MKNKKITIESPVVGGVAQAILAALTEPWGGMNETGAAITPYSEKGCSTSVPDGMEWGLERGEIERFIKAWLTEHKEVLDAKVGGVAISREIDQNNYYHLLCFQTSEQATQYRIDGTETGKLFEIEIPISTVQADTYRAQLVTSRVGSTQSHPFILQRGEDWNVPLRLNAWHIHADDNTKEPLPVTTTVIVERSQNGTDWTQVRTGTISSTDSESSFPLSLNIGPSLDFGSDTDMRVRFRILPFTYEDNGEEKVLSASAIEIYVKTVTLSVSMPDNQWQQAKEVNSGVKNLNGLTFNLLGNVEKTLHLKITNASGRVTYDNEFTGITQIGTYSVNAVDNNGTMGLTTSGVHEIEAWTTCESIDGTTLVSTHIVHQIIVVNKGDMSGALVRRVLLQKMASTVDNFVQSEVCRYMVWNPKTVTDASGTTVVNDPSTNIQVRFIVADASDLSESHDEYLSLPVSAEPGRAYPLTATMEVEDDSGSDTYAAYLHATAMDGTSMLLEPKFLTIDNRSGFQPVRGSVFHLNPKSRDNDEQNAQSIINARTGELISSEWTGFKMDSSDGYTLDENGEKVLRVPAGRSLNICLNPFNWFYSSPGVSKAMTLDVDFCVRNITNEDDPVFKLAEYQDGIGAWLGLMLKPMDGTMIGVTSGTNLQETDFRWAEGRRQHLSISIIPGVQPNEWGDLQYNTVRTPNPQDARGTINLVRVLLNGVIIRETRFTPGRAAEFCTAVAGINAQTGKIEHGLTIGQANDGSGTGVAGADIDIYGIRFWHDGLTPSQQLQNWVSTIPDAATKRRIKAANDILRDDNSGRLSLAKVRGIGRNVLVWHGDMPLIDSDSKKGWAEVSVYDTDGNELPEYSGTFCKETKNLKAKGQGTTAMTYYYWNMQVKLSDVTDTITIPVSQLHDSITATWDGEYVWKDSDNQPTGEVGAWKLKGGCLGKNFPLATESAVAYHGTAPGSDTPGTVIVPDGWIDGNGYYRGMCWQNGPGHPLAQKLVLKINYASSMQSHLIGVNWLFNELHTRYCGENSLQRGTPSEYKAQVAKQVIPVLLFTAGKDVTDTQQTESTAVYQGPGGFGPGKMDKPTWGYVKSAHPYFGMFEGAVNNSILSDMLAPWDDTDHVLANGTTQPAKVKYWLHDPVNAANKDPESFYYRRTKLVTIDVTDEQGNVTGQTTVEQDDWEKGIGFDAGKTGRTNADGDLANSNSCDVASDAPAANITGVIRDAWNYLYLHNPNINLYRGTFDDFKQRSFSETELKQKWVCRSNGNDGDNYKLKRYDFCERQWVDAGLWNGTQHCYDVIDIRYFPGMDWNSMSASEQNDHAAVVAKFKRLLMEEAYTTENNEGIGHYFKVSSLRFHYAFVNLFIAGTDNCSKNTYYVIDPETHLIELHQDDVDTVLATDNYGYQTKPYYIDRKHPYPDGSNISGYDGMNNGLFDIVEALWLDDDTHTIAQTLGEVINLMAQLTGGLPSAESETMGGVWKTLNKYLFNIQRWIPQVAYNEAARIRYEFPAMLGYTGRDGQARPLAQSMGDQLEAEIQFMRRRLVYMASYAGCCEFSPSIGAGRQSTGIDDLGTIFSIPVTALPNGGVPTYTFKLTPHQYIYPCFYQEGNQKQTFHRTAPGEEYEYTVPNLSVNDYAVVLTGLNYYRSIGNVGDMATPYGQNKDYNLELSGTRLTSFKAEPTLYYPTSGGAAISKAAYDALSSSAKAGYQPAFRAVSVELPQTNAATRLQSLSLNGCKTVASSEAIPLDLTRLTIAQEIDLRGTSIQSVTIPETMTLTTLRLPSGLTSLALKAQPSLSTLAIEGYGSLTRMDVTGSPLLGTSMRSHVLNMKAAGTVVTLLRLTGIDWTSVSITADDMRWLLGIGDRGTCDLTGSIVVTDTLNYADVVTLMKRYGDIRTIPAEVPTDRLYVGFGSFSIIEANMSIGGKKYINPSELTTEGLNKWFEELSLSVTDGNNVDIAKDGSGNLILDGEGHPTPDVRWSIAEGYASDYAEFPDEFSPRLLVKQASQTTLTIVVSLKTTSGDVRQVTKKVGLWNRIPEVGDYAWTDGQFDCENDGSKNLAGMVIKREEVTMPADANHSETWTAYKLWVLSAGNSSLPASSDGTSGSVPTSGGQAFTSSWGLYPQTSDSPTLGFNDAKSSGAYVDDIIEAVRQAVDVAYSSVASTSVPRSDIFDTPLPNQGGDVTLRKNAAAVAELGGVAMQVDSGDGWATLTQNYLNNFNTEQENRDLLAYADVILRAVYSKMGISLDQLPSGCDSNGIPRTRQALADVTQIIVQKAADSGIANEARFRMLMFLAVRLCNVWCPSDISQNGNEEDLHPSYARGKWMLPSSGLQARIFNFLGNSRSGYNTNAAPALEYAEQREGGNAPDVNREAMKPLFANAIARGRAVPISSGSTHWSCTEYYRNIARNVNFNNGIANYHHKYNSYAVRAVAAFTFEP